MGAAARRAPGTPGGVGLPSWGLEPTLAVGPAPPTPGVPLGASSRRAPAWGRPDGQPPRGKQVRVRQKEKAEAPWDQAASLLPSEAPR